MWRTMLSFNRLMVPCLFAFVDGWYINDIISRTRIDSGWLCGQTRLAEDGSHYASFRGVPYGKQPLGELRFKELQPVEPWSGCLNATVEGPICPFHNIFYGPLLKPRKISEACIYANVHVPINPVFVVKWPRPGLPILVFIHGGGWVDGSGDSDVNGPEYLVFKKVIVVTFNYRLDVFGFLSLNTTKIPGNNGLRDMVTLLRWVKRNARSFGGNPDDVTIAGQSAGASSAHILTLSPVTKGLFKRAWLMSGTGIQSYYSTSPVLAQQVATSLLQTLGVNSTDYDAAHDILVELPWEVIANASGIVLSASGLTSFVPVTESPLPNVISIIPEDPDLMIAKGYGNDIPLVIGFTNVEVKTSRPRLEVLDILKLREENSLVGLPVNLLYTYPTSALNAMAKKVTARYFGDEPETLDKFIKLGTETYFAYPALKLAMTRATSGGAPVYLYKFSFDANYSVFKIALNLTYHGAGHSEDLARILRVNSQPVPFLAKDQKMTDWMTSLIINFIKHGDPAYGSGTGAWPAVREGPLQYQNITSSQFSYIPITDEDRDLVDFFDTLTDVGREL